MTDNQQPGWGALPAAGGPLMTNAGRLGLSPGGQAAADPRAGVSEPVSFDVPLGDWSSSESEPVTIRHSMPADFPVIELATEKGPSPDQLARRARLQRIVVALVALLGVFDVVMIWAHYR